MKDTSGTARYLTGEISPEHFINEHYFIYMIKGLMMLYHGYKYMELRAGAFLTGRSLSAFKRDFKMIFGETPGRWLILRRLQEAHFLLEKEGKKPSGIYLDLGFETLSHFSFAFKKHFGLTPSALVRNNIK